MTKKQKKMLTRIIISTLLFIVLQLLPFERIPGLIPVKFILYVVDFLIIGYDILKKAGKGIWNRQVFDENFLMAIATLGAFALEIYEQKGNLLLVDDCNEAVAVMLFYQIGEFFQAYAVGKSRKNITQLMDIRPDYANIEKDGQLIQVDPTEVAKGSVIVVQPGEKIPIDGFVVEGTSTLNTSALTGESLPVEVGLKDEVISGSINLKILANLPFLKSLSWSKMLLHANLNLKNLFQNLPEFIHQP